MTPSKMAPPITGVPKREYCSWHPLAKPNHLAQPLLTELAILLRIGVKCESPARHSWNHGLPSK